MENKAISRENDKNKHKRTSSRAKTSRKDLVQKEISQARTTRKTRGRRAVRKPCWLTDFVWAL